MFKLLQQKRATLDHINLICVDSLSPTAEQVFSKSVCCQGNKDLVMADSLRSVYSRCLLMFWQISTITSLQKYSNSS